MVSVRVRGFVVVGFVGYSSYLHGDWMYWHGLGSNLIWIGSVVGRGGKRGSSCFHVGGEVGKVGCW